MFCFAFSCLDLSDDAQKAKLKLQAVSCLRSIFMLFNVHPVIIISLACFSHKTLKMQAFFFCACTPKGGGGGRGGGVSGNPSRVPWNLGIRMMIFLQDESLRNSKLEG